MYNIYIYIHNLRIVYMYISTYSMYTLHIFQHIIHIHTIYIYICIHYVAHRPAIHSLWQSTQDWHWPLSRWSDQDTWLGNESRVTIAVLDIEPQWLIFFDKFDLRILGVHSSMDFAGTSNDGTSISMVALHTVTMGVSNVGV